MAPQPHSKRETAIFSLDDFIASNKLPIKVGITSRPVRIRGSGIVALPDADYDLSVLAGRGFQLEINLKHENPASATHFGCARILYSTGTPTGYELASHGSQETRAVLTEEGKISHFVSVGEWHSWYCIGSEDGMGIVGGERIIKYLQGK